MILATLPVIVRLPASVEAIASTSQAVCGLENPGTSDLSSITAGTLLTILLRTPTAIVTTATCCRFQCSATSSRLRTIPAFSAPPTIRNNPSQSTSNPQSTSSYSVGGSSVRVIKSTAAPSAAIIAGGA